MAMAGSFRRCFDQLIEMLGREPALEMVILKDDSADDYKLMRRADWVTLNYSGDYEETRLVIGVTYYELKEIIKPRQAELFRKVEDGDKQTNIPSGE